MKIYGIPNCDTVKKARKQLDADGVVYEFIDLKTYQLSAQTLGKWLAELPDTIANKRSTTYRECKEQWLSCDTDDKKVNFLMANQTMLKRPVIEHDNGNITVGWPYKS